MADVDPASLRISAPFVNQFQIVVAGQNVRIAFAEGFSGQTPNYRSAVVMSEADARELALSILSSIPSPTTAPPGLFGAGLAALGAGAMTAPNMFAADPILKATSGISNALTGKKKVP